MASITAGSGSDALVLRVAEDAYRGDAQFTVKVDGKQVGGTFASTSSYRAGAADTVTLKGDWAVGPHKVEVAFTNDAYGGSPTADRNLHVLGATYNGAAVSGAAADLWNNGVKAFTVSDATPVPQAPPPAPAGPVSLEAGAGPDALVLKISQDAWNGSAKYTVAVDGKQVGGTFTASAAHSSGQSDTLTLKGDWAAGPHSVRVSFVNNDTGANPADDRNLWLDGAAYNGAAVPAGKQFIFGPAPYDFSFTDGSAPPPQPQPQPAGTAPNAALGRPVALTFRDEFDGNALSWDNGHYQWNSATQRKDWISDADGGNWATQYHWGRGIPANGELGFYSDASVGVDPFRVAGGVLTITAAPSADPAQTNGLPYTTGAITTAGSFAQRYGYFEMRAELDPGQGLWPGFWLLRKDQQFPPEIDVVEAINGEDWIAQSLHQTAPSGGVKSTQAFPLVPDLHEGFHTFGVSWRPDAIDWYLDGVKTASAPTPAEAREPMYLLAQLAVGGNWPGAPDATTPFPAALEIDYIRAWQYDDLR